MTKELRCSIPLCWRREVTLVSSASLRERSINKPTATVQLVCVFLLVIASLTGCSSKEEKPAPPPPGVTIAPVLQKDVPIHQEWVGTMVGNVDAEIRPKVDGFLLTRIYTEGSYVQKGQPMFQLDKRQAQAAVEQATGNLERARAVVEPGPNRCAALYALGGAKGSEPSRTRQSARVWKEGQPLRWMLIKRSWITPS